MPRHGRSCAASEPRARPEARGRAAGSDRRAAGGPDRARQDRDAGPAPGSATKSFAPRAALAARGHVPGRGLAGQEDRLHFGSRPARSARCDGRADHRAIGSSDHRAIGPSGHRSRPIEHRETSAKRIPLAGHGRGHRAAVMDHSGASAGPGPCRGMRFAPGRALIGCRSVVPGPGYCLASRSARWPPHDAWFSGSPGCSAELRARQSPGWQAARRHHREPRPGRDLGRPALATLPDRIALFGKGASALQLVLA